MPLLEKSQNQLLSMPGVAHPIDTEAAAAADDDAALQDRIKPATLIKVGSVEDNNDNNTIPRFVVGYWSMRGLGAPLRMMLSAAHAQKRLVPHYWVALYDVLEDSSEDGQQSWSLKSWTDDKEWMLRECSPFMNLPYLIDVQEQYVLTQSNAILSYLGRELGMMGSTKLETAKCEELLCTIYDLRDVMVHFAYYGKPTAEQCWTTAQKHFQNLESHLTGQMRKTTTTTIDDDDDAANSNGSTTFLVGPKPNAPDFPLFEILDQYEILAEQHDFQSLGDHYPNLALYKKAMEEWSEHQDYLNSFLHRGLPLNNPYAQFASSLSGKCYERGQEAPWRNLGIVVLDSGGS